MANNNSHGAIDELIFLNELRQIGKPSTANLGDIVGTIGPAPGKYGGLSEDELLDVVMSVATPVAGTVRAGKGIMSILKNLFKKSSKSKFPAGYGYGSPKYKRSQLDEALEAIDDPSFLQPSRVTPRTQDELFEILKEVGFKKPKSTSASVIPKKVWNR